MFFGGNHWEGEGGVRTYSFSGEERPDNLCRVVPYLVAQWSKSITRTELVKAVFLFEYLYCDPHGCSYTEATFVRDNYGPNDPLIYETAKRSPFIAEDSYVGYWGVTYEYVVNEAEQVDEYVQTLPSSVLQLLDQTVTTLSTLKDSLRSQGLRLPVASDAGSSQGRGFDRKSPVRKAYRHVLENSDLPTLQEAIGRGPAEGGPIIVRYGHRIPACSDGGNG